MLCVDSFILPDVCCFDTLQYKTCNCIEMLTFALDEDVVFVVTFPAVMAARLHRQRVSRGARRFVEADSTFSFLCVGLKTPSTTPYSTVINWTMKKV